MPALRRVALGSGLQMSAPLLLLRLVVVLVLVLLVPGGCDPVVLQDGRPYSNAELLWEDVPVADSGAVTSVSVAALPVGEKIFLHYVKRLVTDDEAARMIRACDDRSGWGKSPIKREASVTVEGGSVLDTEKKRTSSSCPLVWPTMYRALESNPDAYGEKGASILDEFNLALSVSRRVARLFKVDESLIEPLQLVRYAKGEHYKLHHDHGGYYGFESEKRPYTLLIFLNNVPPSDGGGHTAFPTLATKILPQLGDAILWANVAQDQGGSEGEGEGDVPLLPDAVHEAVGIEKDGTLKFVANVWLGESEMAIKADLIARSRRGA